MLRPTCAMKSILLLSVLLAGSLATATANPIPYTPKPVPVRMHLEKVQIIIVGDRAKVSGTYTFLRNGAFGGDYFVLLPVFLPVYGAKDAPAEDMTPKYMEVSHEMPPEHWEVGDERWDEMWPVQPEDNAKAIASFGQMPQLDGQVVHWFKMRLPRMQLPVGRMSSMITVKMEYWQKLSNGKFIYTPLLPNMKKDHDYGEITIVADRPMKLLDAEKHDFVQKEDRLVVEPFHKRAVVVELGKKPKLLAP